MAEEEKSALGQFREAYPDCLEGFVEDTYVESSGIKEAEVSMCSIRQAEVSKNRITLLRVNNELSIPPTGITKGHRISFFATKLLGGGANYDGILVALLDYNTGRSYASTDESLNPRSLNWKYKVLKWEDVQKPL